METQMATEVVGVKVKTEKMMGLAAQFWMLERKMVSGCAAQMYVQGLGWGVYLTERWVRNLLWGWRVGVLLWDYLLRVVGSC